MREFRKEIRQKMSATCEIDSEFARRYVNDGFLWRRDEASRDSCNLAMLQPKFAVSGRNRQSGLDADAVLTCQSEYSQKSAGIEIGLLIITHHDKLLEHNHTRFHTRHAWAVVLWRRAVSNSRRRVATPRVTSEFANLTLRQTQTNQAMISDEASVA